MYRTHALRASLPVLAAACALSFVGCLGTINDTPKDGQTEQDVGAGTGVDDENQGDGDNASTGDGDNANEDSDDGESPTNDDANDASDSADDGDANPPAEEPPAQDPPAEAPPAEDPPAEDPGASVDRGAEQYATLCVGCHGDDGQGSGGVQRLEDLGQLTEFIDTDMPLGNPGACDAVCAEDIASYILATF